MSELNVLACSDLETPCAFPAGRVMFRPFIYGLVDPSEPAHVRYVGMTLDNPQRPYRHAYMARRKQEHSHLYHWIRTLQADGREPIVLILEEMSAIASPEMVGEIEKDYIKSLREIGHRLTNVAEGGGTGHHAIETRQKMRASALGKPKSAEQRANQSKAMRGKPGRVWSEEDRAEQSARLLADESFQIAVRSKERSTKIANKQRGRKHSAEEIAKQKASCAATRARLRTENGSFRSVESREAAGKSISAAHAARTPEQKQAAVEKRRATIAAKKAKS